MITREELRACRYVIANYTVCHRKLVGGLLLQDALSPIGNTASRRCPSLLGVISKLAWSPALRLETVEKSLSLEQRNAIAEAMFDWTQWTMRHGLGPGIMTALKLGQKEQILEAIEQDLTEDA